jgi:hypothetical protein
MGDHEGNRGPRPPSWDGNPSTYVKYSEDCRMWLLGQNLDVPYSLAARMAMELTGSARAVAGQLTDRAGTRPAAGLASGVASNTWTSTGR